MINEKGVELRTLEIKHKVFDFVWVDSELLIYTSLQKKNLTVYQYNMRKNISKKLAELPAKTKNKDFWVSSPYYGLSLSGNRLFVECDFIPGFYDFETFNAVYVLNLKTNKFTYLKRDKDRNKLEEYGYIWNRGKYNQNQKDVSKRLKVGTDCELYYSKGTNSIRISDTPYKKLREYGEQCIGFDLSPKADKILFTTLEEIGDFEHGKGFIVNLDGTDQQLITSDAARFIGLASIATGNSFILDGEYDESGKYVLKLNSITNTNTPVLIMLDIENAKLRHDNNWKYVLGRGGSPYE